MLFLGSGLLFLEHPTTTPTPPTLPHSQAPAPPQHPKKPAQEPPKNKKTPKSTPQIKKTRFRPTTCFLFFLTRHKANRENPEYSWVRCHCSASLAPLPLEPTIMGFGLLFLCSGLLFLELWVVIFGLWVVNFGALGCYFWVLGC